MSLQNDCLQNYSTALYCQGVDNSPNSLSNTLSLEQAFSRIHLDQLHGVSTIEAVAKSTPFFSAEKEGKVREIRPITQLAIKRQAELFEAMREVKEKMIGERLFKKEGLKNNAVFALPGKSGETIAYYKLGKEGERATGDFEKLIWDIAVVAHLEGQFAPTALIRMRSLQENQAGDESDLIWSKGQLKTATGLGRAKIGGFQLALNGELLLKYISSGQEQLIAKHHLLQCAITSVFIGAFDLHPKNLIYIPTLDAGGFMFFDNTRSFPHSNGVINWGGMIMPSYCSGLLDLAACYEKFTFAEKELLQREVARLKSSIGNIADFLLHPLTQKRLEKLPQGWFNSEQALAALTERMDLIEQSLPAIESIRDLILASAPDFKLIAALHLLASTVPESTDQESSLQQNSVQESKSNRPLLSYFIENLDSDVSPIESLGTSPAEIQEVLVAVQRLGLGDFGCKPVKLLIHSCIEQGLDVLEIEQAAAKASSFDSLLAEIFILSQKAYRSLKAEATKINLKSSLITDPLAKDPLPTELASNRAAHGRALYRYFKNSANLDLKDLQQSIVNTFKDKDNAMRIDSDLGNLTEKRKKTTSL